MITQLFLSLLVQTIEIGRHLLHMRFKAHLLVHPLRLALNYWLIVTVDVQEAMLLGHFYLVANPLKLEVGQVLAAVDPVPDGALYAKYNWDQDLLNHFAILNALRVPQDLLYRGIHLAAARSSELGVGTVPPLNLANHCLEARLVDSHLHDDLVVLAILA